MYLITIFVIVILISVFATIIAESTQNLRIETNATNNYSLIASSISNQTISPYGDGIYNSNFTYYNDIWLSFDGIDDYLFIPDNNYITVSYWINDSTTQWIHIINDSENLYENNVSVSSLTLNGMIKNNTGWYFGINSTGYFNGSIDKINFYNTTINQLISGDIFLNGRS